MYNSRDDKSFTRARNYRPAWRYRVFSAAISRETPKKSELSRKRRLARQVPIFVNNNGRRQACLSIKAQLSGHNGLLENYEPWFAGIVQQKLNERERERIISGINDRRDDWS